MTAPCIVIVAASDLLAGLKARAGDAAGELLSFTDAEALTALHTIVKRRPRVIALERMFAVTPRGSALITRIKADPALRQSEIRVVAHDSDYLRIVPRTPPPSAPALDQRGTRRAPRFKMAANVTAQVDGTVATVIDLSTVGGQVVSPVKLNPNQKIGVALANDGVGIRFSAAVVWTSFEIPPNSGPRYRAGLDFQDADAEAVGAFCERNKA